MVNKIIHGIHKVQEFFGKLSPKEIFNVINDNEDKLCDELFDKSNTKKEFDADKGLRYFGKIPIDKEARKKAFYTDEFIIFSLGYLFNKVPPGEDIVLENCTCLSATANGPKDVEGYMDFDGVRNRVFKLAKKHYPDRVENLKVINMEEQPDNKELFARVKSEGMACLGDGLHQPKIPEDFSSIDMARYLYRAVTQNENLKERIKNFQPLRVAEENQYPLSQYYGLFETACRLNDFLKGKTLQCGEVGQNKYDNLIMQILGTRSNLNKFPELKKLQDFCKTHMGDKKFERVYISSVRYDKEINQRQNMVRNRVRIAAITGVTAAALALIMLGTSWGSNYYELKEKIRRKEKTENILKENIQNKKAEVGVSGHMDESRDGEQILVDINSGTNNLYADFIEMCGMGTADEQSLETLKLLLQNELAQADDKGKLSNLNDIFLDVNQMYYHHKKFLRDKFIPEYKSFLAGLGFNTVFYPDLQGHNDAFENSIKFDGKLKFMFGYGRRQIVNVREDSKNVLRTNNIDKSSAFAPEITINDNILGTYRDMVSHKEYGVLEVIGKTDDGQEFPLIVFCKIEKETFSQQTPHEYVLDKQLAQDFLTNRANK